jgi:hypothetical protein
MTFRFARLAHFTAPLFLPRLPHLLGSSGLLRFLSSILGRHPFTSFLRPSRARIALSSLYKLSHSEDHPPCYGMGYPCVANGYSYNELVQSGYS